MDIGLVVHYYDRSEGTGGYVVELATRFAAEHRVTVYAAGVRTPVPEGVRVVHVPALRGRAYATILTFPAAFAAVRKRHDVVHAQGWVANQADVVTAHIVLGAWREKARAAGVRSAAGERWFGSIVTRREARLFGQNARHLIAPSRQVEMDVARLYGRTGPAHVIPHGFSTATPLPKTTALSQLKLPVDRFIALYVGDARKGLLPALEATAVTPGVHLLVLSGSIAGPFLTRAGELGMADRLHWAGHLRDPAAAYSAADVLVHPTIYDTFGLVVAEAMGYGLPVIVSRAAGVSELIKHGESGWILETGSAAETATALAALARDSQVRQRLGEAGRQLAARRTWDDVAADTLSVYQAAIAR